MKKILGSFLILWSLTVEAGLPPTTLNGVTTFNFKAPNVTRVGGAGLIEGDGTNLLVNPNFEGGTTGWTCTTGTCSVTTTSGEFSEGAQALKILSGSPTAINVSQSVSTLSGSTTQYVVGASYKVDTTMTDFQICTLIAGSEKTCVPSANLIIDNNYHTIEIPEVITPGSTVGIKFKTTATYTSKSVFIDKTYIKQGLGAQALQLDPEYSAQVSITGVVSSEDRDFINGNFVVSPTGTLTGTFTSGIFSSAPNCQATATSDVDFNLIISSVSSTTVVIKGDLAQTAATARDTAFSLSCKKSGNDYLAASSAVYSQEGNGEVLLSAHTTGNHSLTGDVTNLTTDVTDKDTHGKWSGSVYTVPVAGDYVAQLMMVESAGTNRIDVYVDGAISGYLGTTSTTGVGGGSKTLKDLTVGQTISFRAHTTTTANASSHLSIYKVPSSTKIVGSFAGYSNVPGYQGNVDTFSVSYGTTNATTVCSASPCSYLDQIGTAVSSMSRSSAGQYVLNLNKTYTKLKCAITNPQAANGGNAGVSGSSGSCSGCNSITLKTLNTTGASSGWTDTFGDIFCQGTY